MATRTWATAPSSATDALFRAWGKAISDSFAAFGWTLDPYQPAVNWATVLAPTTFVPSGWPTEYWLMGDALAAARPVNLQISYGTASAGGAPSISLTVYDKSNTSGGIVSGFGTPTRKSRSWATAYTTLGSSQASGDASRVAFAFWNVHPGSEHTEFFSLERTKDASGNDTTDGFIFCLQEAGNRGSLCIGTTAIAPGAFEENFPAILPLTASTYASGVNVGVSPVIPMLGQAWPPGENQLLYKPADFAVGVPFPANIYGTTRTYWPLGTKMPGGSGSTFGEQLAMRWD